jgi:hypothetical protein
MWDLTIPGDHDFYISNSQAADMAKRLGYRPTNRFIRGQRVYYNGKTYIVQDIDSHSGGLWKMAKSIRGLTNKKIRMGAYDYNGKLHRKVN